MIACEACGSLGTGLCHDCKHDARGAQPPPALTEWEIAAIARSSAREAFAWVICIGLVLGMTAAHILMGW